MAGLVQVPDDDEQRVWRGFEGGERESLQGYRAIGNSTVSGDVPWRFNVVMAFRCGL